MLCLENLGQQVMIEILQVLRKHPDDEIRTLISLLSRVKLPLNKSAKQ